MGGREIACDVRDGLDLTLDERLRVAEEPQRRAYADDTPDVRVSERGR